MSSVAAAGFEAAGVSQPARLARILSLRGRSRWDEMALARRVGAGLPVSSVEGLVHRFGREAIIGPMLSASTWDRIRKAGKPLSRDHSDRVYMLSRVIDAAARAYGDDAERLKAFLTRRHPLLEGEAPFAVASASAAGADAVLTLLARAEAGVAP